MLGTIHWYVQMVFISEENELKKSSPSLTEVCVTYVSAKVDTGFCLYFDNACYRQPDLSTNQRYRLICWRRRSENPALPRNVMINSY